MAQPMQTEVELIAGKPAQFKVFYLRNGKLYFDAMWAPGTDEAAAKVLGFARNLRWKNVEIVRVERINRA